LAQFQLSTLSVGFVELSLWSEEREKDAMKKQVMVCDLPTRSSFVPKLDYFPLDNCIGFRQSICPYGDATHVFDSILWIWGRNIPLYDSEIGN
jgi:hypothetical protein